MSILAWHAFVVSPGHPLNGQTVEVGTLTNGLYPLTVVDEPWHTGYAYKEQLLSVTIIPMTQDVMSEDGIPEEERN